MAHRPSLYKPEYCTEVIRLGQEGKSKTQMSAHFGVSPTTLANWAKDPNHPEFKESFKIAVTLAEAYWEDIGQKGIKGLLTKFVPAPWIFMMKARYRGDWLAENEQKIDLTNTVKAMTDKELDETIKALVARKATIEAKAATEPTDSP